MAKKIYSLNSGNLEPLGNNDEIDLNTDGVNLKVKTPTDLNHAVSKSYVDGLVGGSNAEVFKLSAQDITNGFITLSQLPSNVDAIRVFVRGAGLQFNKSVMDALGEQGDFSFHNEDPAFNLYFKNIGPASGDNLTEDLAFIFKENAVLAVFY